MSYGEKVCCCLPVRIGALIMSFLIFCIYFICTVLMFVYRAGLEDWSTQQQNVDTPLTIEAFNGVFYSFAAIFISYTVVSILGMTSIILQHRKIVRIYHVVNWFFVLLLFTTTIAFWTYFKVKQDQYVNDCQDTVNMQNNFTGYPFYTTVPILGKQKVAPGSDKSECINFIKHLVIGTGVWVFVLNFVQLYWARSIGIYATTLKKHYQHQRLDIKDDDTLLISE